MAASSRGRLLYLACGVLVLHTLVTVLEESMLCSLLTMLVARHAHCSPCHCSPCRCSPYSLLAMLVARHAHRAHCSPLQESLFSNENFLRDAGGAFMTLVMYTLSVVWYL